MLLFIRAPFYVLLVFIICVVCLLVVLVNFRYYNWRCYWNFWLPDFILLISSLLWHCQLVTVSALECKTLVPAINKDISVQHLWGPSFTSDWSDLWKNRPLNNNQKLYWSSRYKWYKWYELHILCCVFFLFSLRYCITDVSSMVLVARFACFPSFCPVTCYSSKIICSHIHRCYHAV